MIRWLTKDEIVAIHAALLSRSGGLSGVRDEGMLLAAISQPRQTFSGSDLYPTLLEKAAALCYFLVSNHPFVDGNKRVGHASMEVLLQLNGYEIVAETDEQERVILALAAGELPVAEFTEWVFANVMPLDHSPSPN